ncbi:CRISPR-associated protein Cas5 [Kyrpidia tusciae]|uniref:CRISPR-associated protein Cas5 n=1 Tax=Kyrpidia tusciae (strain DSM 2912 / NBRC 15312 / T2) TaxID=562970 RepID=D5WUB2_KYRT2|nr:CRISPR-associated protein Cas5 [Kyrpidia tusciae]ADG07364.1 CRISPR-associated protein Cas5 [Kyrpidia tusciae DSM 2912]
MKVLSFRLQGKMAHFRRYYSNSSALSYSIPPRTTVVGIVAGLLGWSRDTYYEVFSLNRCRVAVRNAAPIKKQIQKLNLLMVDRPNDLNGSQPHHSQTPTELVMPQDIRQGFLDYQVWFWHEDEDVMSRFESVAAEIPGYRSKGIALALGAACHLGWLVPEGSIRGERIQTEDLLPVASAIPLRNLRHVDMSRGHGHYRFIREELPLEFDGERRPTERGRGDMLINLTGDPVPAVVSSAVQLDGGTYITWME